MIHPDDTVLFQGDSITDAGRDRKTATGHTAAALGTGYAYHAAGLLLSNRPDSNLTILNRGVGGDQVTDLATRWKQDCLDLQPTVLSVLVGVNDTWHGTAKGKPEQGTDLETYDETYRQLLDDAIVAMSKIRFVICEPFTLRCGAVDDAWFPEMDQRRDLVRKIAVDYEATFVPFQQMFDNAAQTTSPTYWAADGVHPSLAGHMLMARTWASAVTEF